MHIILRVREAQNGPILVVSASSLAIICIQNGSSSVSFWRNPAVKYFIYVPSHDCGLLSIVKPWHKALSQESDKLFLLLSHNPKLLTSSTAEIHFWGVCWVQKNEIHKKKYIQEEEEIFFYLPFLVRCIVAIWIKENTFTWCAE